MTSRLIGRADLLRALAATGGACVDETAAMLGFERIAPRPSTRSTSNNADTTSPQPQPPPSISTGDLQPTPFWQADRFAVRQDAPPLEASRASVSAGPDRVSRESERAVIHLLAPWRELLPRIRGATAINAPTGDVDVDRVVEAWSRGRQRDPLPRVHQRHWPRELHVIVDRSDRLVPFWRDQDALILELKHLMPGRRLRLARLDEAMDEPEFLDGPEGYAAPEAGGIVLALSDLGSLEGDRSVAAATWRALARRAANQEAAPPP